MKYPHNQLDPFIEHEHLQGETLTEEKRFRETKTKFVLRDRAFDRERDKVEFRVRKDGGIEISISTWQDRRTSRTHRCDLGHYHPVIVREKFQYQAFELDPKEAAAFKKFLARGGKWKGFESDEE